MRKEPRTLTLGWNECAGAAIRKQEMEYVAACVLENLPESYPADTRITINVQVKPRSGADDVAALVDYIESGGRPSIQTAETALECLIRRRREQ